MLRVLHVRNFQPIDLVSLILTIVMPLSHQWLFKISFKGAGSSRYCYLNGLTGWSWTDGLLGRWFGDTGRGKGPSFLRRPPDPLSLRTNDARHWGECHWWGGGCDQELYIWELSASAGWGGGHSGFHHPSGPGAVCLHVRSHEVCCVAGTYKTACYWRIFIMEN